MAFTQKLPEWNATGVEPSETQKQTGFQPGVRPPAQWFNWHLNWSYLALKELQEKAAEKSYVDAELDTIQADIQQLQEDVQNADIPDASLTVKGKTQLSSATNSTSEDRAATPKAVKTAYDEALAAKLLGVEQKNNVVAALNSIGVSASTSESWTQLINKISAVIRATGNATPAQVLSGVPFSNSTGSNIVGTMPNRSGGTHHQALSTEVWQGDRAFFKPPLGYFDGLSWVFALTPDLLSANIRAGKNVLGVTGTLAAGVSPGSTRIAYDPSSSIPSTYNTAPVLVREITMNTGGTYRVSYGIRADVQGFNYAYGQLYVNGAARGIQRSTFNETVTYFTEDIAINAGEILQLYIWTSNSSYRALYYSNMSIFITDLTSQFR